MYNTILLFTVYFPFGEAGEATFLYPEIEYLAKAFERIILVPELIEGDLQKTVQGVEVEEGLARFMVARRPFEKVRSFFSVLLSPEFYRELAAHPFIIARPAAFKRLCIFIISSVKAKKWVGRYIRDKGFDLGSTVFYTYWLNHVSMGIGLFKKSHPDIYMVSRVHGYDLYEERHQPPYFPCRDMHLGFLDRLFPISEHGHNYLVKRYPRHRHKFEISRLGVKDPGFTTEASADGIIRVVSCSYMVPVKRLELLAKGMLALAEKRPDKIVEWHHMGDGPERERVKDSVSGTGLKNIRCIFHGHLSNEKVFDFYRNNPVDVFINTSLSEGIPVAIMEAQSCGIPVIAPAVGGIPEIVSHKTGLLLGPDPTPQEIADGVCNLLEDTEAYCKMRKEARENWNRLYNAHTNYYVFSRRIIG